MTKPTPQPKKVPTIANLLSSIPSGGTETTQGTYATYATLAWYWDGSDRKNNSVRKLSKLVSEMDSFTLTELGEVESTPLEDEDNDRFGVRFEFLDGRTKEVWFTSPTLKNMPKPTKDMVALFHSGLSLADDSDLILALPYTLFSDVCVALGKSLGM